jgi:hypothetical protein
MGVLAFVYGHGISGVAAALGIDNLSWCGRTSARATSENLVTYYSATNIESVAYAECVHLARVHAQVNFAAIVVTGIAHACFSRGNDWREGCDM